MLNELNRSTGVEPPSPPIIFCEDLERCVRPKESDAEYIKRRIAYLFAMPQFSQQCCSEVICDIKYYLDKDGVDSILLALFQVLAELEWGDDEVLRCSLLHFVGCMTRSNQKGVIFEDSFLSRAAARIVEPSAITPAREACILW
jgi:hypothetical protein